MGSETQLPALRQRAAAGCQAKQNSALAGVDSDVCSRSAGFQLVAAVAERSRALPTAGGALELALQGTSFTARARVGIKDAWQSLAHFSISNVLTFHEKGND